MKNNLRELLLNSNPLRELPGAIKSLRNLKILGIAHTKITELPK